MIKKSLDSGAVQAREAAEVISEILNIFASLETQNKWWQFKRRNKWLPVQTEEQVLVHGKGLGNIGIYVKEITIRIERRRVVREPKNRIQKLMQGIMDALEPSIVVQPLFEHAKVHCVTIDLLVGERRLADPRDLSFVNPFKGELEEIFKTLKEKFPELNYRG